MKQYDDDSFVRNPYLYDIQGCNVFTFEAPYLASYIYYEEQRCINPWYCQMFMD